MLPDDSSSNKKVLKHRLIFPTALYSEKVNNALELNKHLFQKIKEIAAKKNPKLVGKDFSTPEEKEEYKKNIQGYMNDRLKEIVGQHKLQRKLSKIPKTLINQHDELTKEIVADLRKF